MSKNNSKLFVLQTKNHICRIRCTWVVYWLKWHFNGKDAVILHKLMTTPKQLLFMVYFKLYAFFILLGFLDFMVEMKYKMLRYTIDNTGWSTLNFCLTYHPHQVILSVLGWGLICFNGLFWRSQKWFYHITKIVKSNHLFLIINLTLHRYD